MAIKYAAKVDHVHEVSLRGDANAHVWRDALATVQLAAAEQNGRVAMMLSATSARFRGMRFREFSISVLAREEESGTEGWYLAHAFNSSRFFAWIERTVFATPYYAGQISVTGTAPAAAAAQSGDAQVSMAMDGNIADRRPIRRGFDAWEGPLFLPVLPGRNPSRRKWFFAKLNGEADVYAFLPDRDDVTIALAPQWPVLAQFAAANFIGREWLLRTDASHAKSHTYSRPVASLSR